MRPIFAQTFALGKQRANRAGRQGNKLHRGRPSFGRRPSFSSARANSSGTHSTASHSGAAFASRTRRRRRTTTSTTQSASMRSMHSVLRDSLVPGIELMDTAKETCTLAMRSPPLVLSKEHPVVARPHKSKLRAFGSLLYDPIYRMSDRASSSLVLSMDQTIWLSAPLLHKSRHFRQMFPSVVADHSAERERGGGGTTRRRRRRAVCIAFIAVVADDAACLSPT